MSEECIVPYHLQVSDPKKQFFSLLSLSLFPLQLKRGMEVDKFHCHIIHHFVLSGKVFAHLSDPPLCPDGILEVNKSTCPVAAVTELSPSDPTESHTFYLLY